LQLALVVFILYIGGTALGTAGGRLNLGVMQAIADRYNTPALMAWSVILVLYASMIARKTEEKLSYALPLLFIPFLLLPQQLEVFNANKNSIFEKQVAALSLELGVNDLAQLANIDPTVKAFVDYTFNISKIASERNLSIFNHPSLKDASKLMGTQIETQPSSLCIGFLDTINTIDSDSRYVRVNGWLFEPTSRTVPQIIYMLNSDNRIVGYGVTGRPRPDVKSSIDRKAGLSGLTGYVFVNESDNIVNLQGLNPSCLLVRS
jgi:hypothetical protein